MASFFEERRGKNEIIAVITKGFGYGNTKKSALDNALKQAGICDFNLLPLTSILPFSCIIYNVNLREILYNNALINAYGSCLKGVISIYVGKRRASAGLAMSVNPYCPFIIEAHSRNVNDCDKELQRGANEMLYNRLSTWPFFLKKEEIEKEKEKIKYFIVSAGSEKHKFTASVCALIFIDDQQLLRAMRKASKTLVCHTIKRQDAKKLIRERMKLQK